MTWTTAQAVDLATTWHNLEPKFDPGSKQPYITHPIRVMEAVKAAGYDERYQRVAVLHDAIEDTDLTAEDLRKADASEEEIAAILSVTKTDGEVSYPWRVVKAAQNEIGGVVKGFDMLDNSNLERMRLLTQTEPEKAARLAPKYAIGLVVLDLLRPGGRQQAGPQGHSTRKPATGGAS